MNSVRDAVHPIFDPDAAQGVVQRAGAAAQIELRVQRVGQVSLGPGDRFFQRKPFGKVGRNGTGQSAAARACWLRRLPTIARTFRIIRSM